MDRGDADLPPPAVANGLQASKKTSFENSVRAHWVNFCRRIANSSSPSGSTSVELTGSTTEASFIKLAGSNKLVDPEKDMGAEEDEGDDDEEVNQVVVDTIFVTQGDSKTSTQAYSEHQTRSGESDSDQHSFTQHTGAVDGWFGQLWCLASLRFRFLPAVNRFLTPSFYNEAVEGRYLREAWYTNKHLALYSGVFLIVNWILGCVLVSQPWTILEKVFYYGISPALAVPVPFFVIYDIPHHYPTFYQVYITISIWSWSYFNLIFMNICGYYGTKSYMSCGTKDFLGTFYYASALPAIGLFGLRQSRFSALCASVTFMALMIGLIIPNRRSWIRLLFNMLAYHVFLAYVHYMREMGERRLYTLRDQLKVQYRATQKAQVSERKAADSKRRLTSYIFHEVRIPLNTLVESSCVLIIAHMLTLDHLGGSYSALLAVQNMAATDNTSRDKEKSIEFTALEGSLAMMSKVLNDVLDFNRMDSGRFESNHKPYAFHTVIRSVLVPLRLAASSRGLELITELDGDIDLVARRAMLTAQGKSRDWVDKKIAEEKEEGIVVGDEMRLRQIITNLASNACKFTPAGGKIHIRTKLIQPTADELILSTSDESTDMETSSTDAFRPQRHPKSVRHHQPPHSRIVVRIEVEDTGVGIRQRDLHDNRLFSPYVQTEIGRNQGGKGTGLGLALVRHIVKLSGGRLGVKSKRGEGSIFWVELAPGIGKSALQTSKDHTPDLPLTASYQDTPWTLDPTSPLFEGITPSSVESSPPPSRALPSANAGDSVSARTMSPQDSALVTIMEHGGMVELRPTLRTAYSYMDPLPSGTDLSPSPGLSFTTSHSGHHPPSHPPTPGSMQSTANSPVAVLNRPLPSPKPPGPAEPPSAPAPPALTRTAPSNSSGDDPWSNMHVLVVDDDPLTRKLMSRLLTRIGCTVETAENGQVALEMILASGTTPFFETSQASTSEPETQGRFEVVFLDNQMPILSGVGMTRRLRGLGRKDFIVGVTGNALKEDQIEYLEAGVDHVLTKPVLERSLKSMLAKAAERRKERFAMVPEEETGQA
ncbi:hypothetical protein BOTBODRAFT_178696 [Botryobasidium botryosum FD-172 SS1]|uniref:histidine kinase n=1 Tax=Botryobasidium botryosum (strain FD-172 SS1) TaxID=930990 RepID=A0A067MDX7_BOTB1|nr:hypothetical protein BOTBODRAFT_178696 [Botryobasidium botryosum FD-172 SS1]